MKILLYRPDAETAFRKYDNPCEIKIPTGKREAWIINPDQNPDANANLVIEKYELIKKPDPIWTDDTKMFEEVMVKLTVGDLIE